MTFIPARSLAALVKRLRELQCTVIILSATLTENRRRELLGLADEQPVSAAYPLVSGVVSSFIEERVRATTIEDNSDTQRLAAPYRWKKR